MTVSILLATTGRPEMAKACVEGIWDTTDGHDVEVVAAVDADGETTLVLHELGCVVDYSETYRGCSKAWNDALGLATGDPVVLAGDDLVWQEGWLDAALQALAYHPDSLIGFNDGHWGEELSTHYLMPRHFICEVLGGVVTWSHYAHSFNDREANERARLAERYFWCEEARVYHYHWLFGDRAQDETDTRSLVDHADSERIFEERKAKGFPNDVPPVIQCRQ